MTNRSLTILGAGGHAKVVADIAMQTGRYATIRYLDDNSEKGAFFGGEICGKSTDFAKYLGDLSEFFVAIGSNKIRKQITEELLAHSATLATLIHPSATVASSVKIGAGSLIVAGAVINPDTEVGVGCIVNTNASVDHDCKIGDFVHIAPNSALAGQVTVGTLSFVGLGSSVIQVKSVGENVTIGAGSVVIKNVPDNQTVVGCPAKAMIT